MKKGLLVLNLVFATSLAWALFYSLRFNNHYFRNYEVWLAIMPAIFCGFWAIPANVARLFIGLRRNKFFKKLFSALDRAGWVLLPIIDFFYIPIFLIFFVPIIFEINSCFIENDRGDYCAYYFRSGDYIFELLCFLVFLWLSALLISWNVAKVKKDKKFLLAILFAFTGVILPFLISNFLIK